MTSIPRARAAGVLAAFSLLGTAAELPAQDLVITNARIIVGTGQVIERGSIVVRNGRIATVAAGAVTAPGLPALDARGMTAMAGLIDGHRHIIGGNPEQWFKDQAAVRMQEFLEAGYTTLMSGGGPVPGIVQLKEIYGFGTDTGYHPRLGLAHELRALNVMFSPQDLVKVLGPNTAAFIEKNRELGTLEAGKLADIAMFDGNPLEGYWHLLNAKVVVKGGQVVVDKR